MLHSQLAVIGHGFISRRATINGKKFASEIGEGGGGGSILGYVGLFSEGRILGILQCDYCYRGQLNKTGQSDYMTRTMNFDQSRLNQSRVVGKQRLKPQSFELFTFRISSYLTGQFCLRDR